MNTSHATKFYQEPHMPEVAAKKPRKTNPYLATLVSSTGKSEAECRAMLGMRPPPARLTGKKVTVAIDDALLARIDAAAAKAKCVRAVAIIDALRKGCP